MFQKIFITASGSFCEKRSKRTIALVLVRLNVWLNHFWANIFHWLCHWVFIHTRYYTTVSITFYRILSDFILTWILLNFFYKYLFLGDIENIELNEILPIAEYIPRKPEVGKLFEELFLHFETICRLVKVSFLILSSEFSKRLKIIFCDYLYVSSAGSC